MWLYYEIPPHLELANKSGELKSGSLELPFVIRRRLLRTRIVVIVQQLPDSSLGHDIRERIPTD